MFRRFEATIPLKRLVTVTFNSYRQKDAREVWSITGMPWKNLAAVIWLKVNTSSLQGIPKDYVISIEGAHMPAQEAKPVQPDVLTSTDPKFERFRTAIMLEERVRITYLLAIKPDPAIQNSTINERGLPTICEGKPIELDDHWLHIAIVSENGVEMTNTVPNQPMKSAIRRDTVMDIVFLGPRPVPAEEMV